MVGCDHVIPSKEIVWLCCTGGRSLVPALLSLRTCTGGDCHLDFLSLPTQLCWDDRSMASSDRSSGIAVNPCSSSSCSAVSPAAAAAFQLNLWSCIYSGSPQQQKHHRNPWAAWHPGMVIHLGLSCPAYGSVRKHYRSLLAAWACLQPVLSMAVIATTHVGGAVCHCLSQTV